MNKEILFETIETEHNKWAENLSAFCKKHSLDWDVQYELITMVSDILTKGNHNYYIAMSKHKDKHNILYQLYLDDYLPVIQDNCEYCKDISMEAASRVCEYSEKDGLFCPECLRTI